MNQLFTFADFFAGCGGLSHGFHAKASFKGIFATDNWGAAKNNYILNAPDANFKLLDMHKQSDIQGAINECINKTDIVIGGPPCQGFSTLGKRAADCKLSTLVDVFLDMAVKINPKIIIMENVRGITSKKHPSGSTYKEFIHNFFDQLPDETYNYADLLIDCSEFGLAQTRIRYLLIAVRKDINQNNDVLNKIISSISQQKSVNKLVLKDVIGDLPIVNPGDGVDEVLQDTFQGKRKVFNHKAMNHSEALQKRFSHIPPGGGLPDVPVELLTPHLIKMLQGGYGSGGHIKNIYGRLKWSEPCGTIVAGIDKITCGRFVHPDLNRLLTPRECARIQSFPDNFRFSGGSVTQYYLIGNAVPPKISAVLANAVNQAFSDCEIKVENKNVIALEN